MVYVCTTEAEIVQKAGAGKSPTFDTTMMEAAELRHLSTVNVICRYSWTADMPTNDQVKGLLSDIVSSLIAMEAIAYDMSGYTSRIEAEDMITVLRDSALRNISILREQQAQDFIKDESP